MSNTCPFCGSTDIGELQQTPETEKEYGRKNRLCLDCEGRWQSGDE